MMKEDKLLGEGYATRGNALYFNKEYGQALEYYNKAAQVFENLDEVEPLTTVLSQMAYCYAALEQREQERECLNRGAGHPAISPLVQSTLLERMAISLDKSGLRREAIAIYEQALSIYEAERFARGWQDRIQNLAEMYRAAGDEDAAQRTRARKPLLYDLRI